jgi:hypothetical protein
MMRTLSIATVLAAAIALPAMAEDTKTKIEPGSGPTSTMTDAVPQMKRDAEAIKEDGPDSAKPLPSSKAMGEAVPSMRPGDAVSGQSDTKTSPGVTTATGAAAPAAGISLNVQEGMTWINKPVYSSDGKEIGEVAAFQRDADNKVIGMHADVGGFLGLGQTRVDVTPAQFKLQGDRVVLSLTAEQAKDLPAVKK